MAKSSKYGYVVVESDSERNPLNDTEEPVFVLRAADKSTLLVLQYYADINAVDNPQMQGRMGKVFDIFATWREDNSEKVKVAD